MELGHLFDWGRLELPNSRVEPGNETVVTSSTRLHAAISDYWAVLEKNEKHEIDKGQYKALWVRLLRVLLPDASSDLVEVLSENAWKDDCKGTEGLCLRGFMKAMDRFSSIWAGKSDEGQAALLSELFLRISVSIVSLPDGSAEAVRNPVRVGVSPWGEKDEMAEPSSFGMEINVQKEASESPEGAVKPGAAGKDKDKAAASTAPPVFRTVVKQARSTSELFFPSGLHSEEGKVAKLCIDEYTSNGLSERAEQLPSTPVEVRWAETSDIVPLGALLHGFCRCIALTPVVLEEPSETQKRGEAGREAIEQAGIAALWFTGQWGEWKGEKTGMVFEAKRAKAAEGEAEETTTPPTKSPKRIDSILQFARMGEEEEEAASVTSLIRFAGLDSQRLDAGGFLTLDVMPSSPLFPFLDTLRKTLGGLLTDAASASTAALKSLLLGLPEGVPGEGESDPLGAVQKFSALPLPVSQKRKTSANNNQKSPTLSLLGKFANSSAAGANPNKVSISKGEIMDLAERSLAFAGVEVAKQQTVWQTAADLKAAAEKRERLLAEMGSLNDSCTRAFEIPMSRPPSAGDSELTKKPSTPPTQPKQKGIRPFTMELPDPQDPLVPFLEDLGVMGKTPQQTVLLMGTPSAAKSRTGFETAERLGLEWVSVDRILQIALKVPPSKQTPFLKRLLAQVNAGQAAEAEDLLRLSTHFLSSAKAQTSGYLLDVPASTPEEMRVFLNVLRKLSTEETLETVAFYSDDKELPEEKDITPYLPKEEDPNAAEGEGGAEGEGKGEGEADADGEAKEGEKEGEGDAADKDGEEVEEEKPVVDGGVTEEDLPQIEQPEYIATDFGSDRVQTLVIDGVERQTFVSFTSKSVELTPEERAKKVADMEEAGEEPPAEDAVLTKEEKSAWLCVLNYKRPAETTPSPKVLPASVESFPIPTGSEYDVDESDSQTAFGHLGLALLSRLPFRRTRWFAVDPQNDQCVHFATSSLAVVKYLQTGQGGFPEDLEVEELEGHNVGEFGVGGDRLTDRGDMAMTDMPFFQAGGKGGFGWAIGAGEEGKEWQVFRGSAVGAPSWHQVFVEIPWKPAPIIPPKIFIRNPFLNAFPRAVVFLDTPMKDALLEAERTRVNASTGQVWTAEEIRQLRRKHQALKDARAELARKKAAAEAAGEEYEMQPWEEGLDEEEEEGADAAEAEEEEALPEPPMNDEGTEIDIPGKDLMAELQPYVKHPFLPLKDPVLAFRKPPRLPNEKNLLGLEESGETLVKEASSKADQMAKCAEEGGVQIEEGDGGDWAPIPVYRVNAEGLSVEETAGVIESRLVTTGNRHALVPAPLAYEIPEAADVGELKELLTKGLGDDENPPKYTRKWSRWGKICPVALREEGKIKKGEAANAVDYCGRVLLFSSPEAAASFRMNPRPFLESPPSLPQTSGFVVVGPPKSGRHTQAARLAATYGFLLIDIEKMIEEAWDRQPLTGPEPEKDPKFDPPAQKKKSDKKGAKDKKGKKEAAAEEEANTNPEDIPPRLRPPDWPSEGELRMTPIEKADLERAGQVGDAVAVRAIACALGLWGNLRKLIDRDQRQVELKAKLEVMKAEAEKAAADGKEIAPEDDPASIPVDEETGEPIVEIEGEMDKVPRGFVVVGFPLKDEQFLALQAANIEVSAVIQMAVQQTHDEEEVPEMADLLAAKPRDANSVGPLDEMIAGFEATVGAIGDEREALTVPMQVSEEETFLSIRRAIDPFFLQCDDPEMVLPPPEEPEETEPQEDEDGNIIPPPEPPFVPFGESGHFCPVTLREDGWLFPGSKDPELLCTVMHRFYRLADPPALRRFRLHPGRYLPSTDPLQVPPPRILVLGASGSGASSLASTLSSNLAVPLLNLGEEYQKALADAKTKRKEKIKEEAEAAAKLEPIVDDEGNLIVKEEEEKPEGEEEEEVEEELEPEVLEDLQTEALKSLLHPQVGALVIDGSFLSPHLPEEGPDIDEEAVKTDGICALLEKLRRLPDAVILVRSPSHVAARREVDSAAIDRATFAKKVAKADEKAKKRWEKMKAREERARRRSERKEAGEEEGEGEEEEAEEEAEEEEAEEEEEPPEEPDEDGIIRTPGERAVEAFVVKFTAESAVAAAMGAKYKETGVPVREVDGSRPTDKVLTAALALLKGELGERTSLLEKAQTQKIGFVEAKELLRAGVARVSRFGRFSPLDVDAPVCVPVEGAKEKEAVGGLPVLYRDRLYFPAPPRGIVATGTEAEEARKEFMKNPLKFINQPRVLPAPPVEVRLAVAVLGPPLSGKTTLCKNLAAARGAVHIRPNEALDWVTLRRDNALAVEIAECLEKGEAVPAGLVAQAIARRLLCGDCRSRGFVLDDFPHTEEETSALAACKALPTMVLLLEAPEALTFSRCDEMKTKSGAGTESEEAAQAQSQRDWHRARLKKYDATRRVVVSAFAENLGLVRSIDASICPWAVRESAVRLVDECLANRQEFLRVRVQRGSWPVSVKGSGLTPELLWERKDPKFLSFCPVTLSVQGELADCIGRSDLAVFYKNHVYWTETEAANKAFLEDPDSFLRAVLPTERARLAAAQELLSAPPPRMEGYCPVTLVDTGRAEKGAASLPVFYMKQLWYLRDRACLSRFLRRPWRFAQEAPPRLPAKLPLAEELGKGPRTLAAMATERRRQRAAEERAAEEAAILGESLKGKKTFGSKEDPMQALREALKETVSFLEATVAEAVVQAACKVGRERPLEPVACGSPSSPAVGGDNLNSETGEAAGTTEAEKNATETVIKSSALRALAAELKARNPQNSETAAKQAEEARTNLAAAWSLPKEVKGWIAKRRQAGSLQGSKERGGAIVPGVTADGKVRAAAASWSERDEEAYLESCRRFDALFSPKLSRG